MCFPRNRKSQFGAIWSVRNLRRETEERIYLASNLRAKHTQRKRRSLLSRIVVVKYGIYEKGPTAREFGKFFSANGSPSNHLITSIHRISLACRALISQFFSLKVETSCEADWTKKKLWTISISVRNKITTNSPINPGSSKKIIPLV